MSANSWLTAFIIFLGISVFGGICFLQLYRAARSADSEYVRLDDSEFATTFEASIDAEDRRAQWAASLASASFIVSLLCLWKWLNMI